MAYVYYNLRLQVKQIDKEPNIDAISLDDIDTLCEWRVESEEPAMEEAPEWLAAEEEEADVSEGGGVRRRGRTWRRIFHFQRMRSLILTFQTFQFILHRDQQLRLGGPRDSSLGFH